MKLLKLNLAVPFSHLISKIVNSNLLHSPTSFKVVGILGCSLIDNSCLESTSYL